MTTRLLVVMSALSLLAVGEAEAMTYDPYRFVENMLSPKRMSHSHSLTPRNGYLLLVACDPTVLAQCQSDCGTQRVLCETGHDDNLPCEPDYSTCLANCQDIADCN